MVEKDGALIIDTLQWNGVAKTVVLSNADSIDEFKTTNPNRPDKDIVYPFALLLLLIVGYLNFKRSKSPN